MKLVRSQLMGLLLFLGVTIIFVISTTAFSDNGDEGRGSVDNSYMEGADYVGSTTCQGCHADAYANWENTLHTKKVRPIEESIVIADFTSDPTLVGEGLPPITIGLYHEAGTDVYTIDLGGQNYTVDWVLGAGAWKQQYMVDIENGTFILPLQWNTADVEWVGYYLEDWFDAQGDPRSHDWGFGSDPLKQVALDRSWDKNCAGCHTTGYTPKQNGNDEWISMEGDNMVEYNVGCEACHGPGSEHITASTPEDRQAYIWNSTDSNICAQCHSRGTSNDGEHGYPVGMYPGDDIWDHYVLDTENTWPEVNIAKEHHQQWMDWNTSGHSRPTPSHARRLPCANCHTPEGARALFAGEELEELPEQTPWSVTCMSCHSIHGTDHEHDLRAEKDELCITCHNAQESTPGETPHHPMYEMLTGQGGVGLIGDLRMGGAVTCTDCHMPKTAVGATEYDIASHSFWFVEPQRTIELGIPNSCTSSCHNGVGDGHLFTLETAQEVIEKWHIEIEDMNAMVDNNLTQAAIAIDQAQALGIDTVLLGQARDIFEIAEFNYDLVNEEGSRGVHNFEYARALLYDSYLKTLEVRAMLDVEPPANRPPMAEAGETIVAEQGAAVSFDGSGSTSPEGTTLTYFWDFGDQVSDTGSSPTHVYTTVGIYTVTLTVTDEDTQMASDTTTVYVINTTTGPVNVEELINDLNALKEDNEALKNDLDEKASKDDLSHKVGAGALFLLLFIALIAVAGSYLMSKLELDKLKAQIESEESTARSRSFAGPKDPSNNEDEGRD